MPVMRHLNVGGTTYDTVGEASVTQVLSSGTKIATISIDGTSTDLYAPEGGSSVDPATAAPSMDGTAAVGSSAKYAREDHVHPHDTSRLSGVILNTSSEPYDVPVSNSSATIYIGDGLSVSDSNNRVTLSATATSMTDTEVDDAVAVAFPEYSVTVSLTNPVHPSYFSSTAIYISEDGSRDGRGYFNTGAMIGRFQSPYGELTVTSNDYGIVVNQYGAYLTLGNVTCTGGASLIGTYDNQYLIRVTGDCTVTIDGTDYYDD